jgi:hypothetical protein
MGEMTKQRFLADMPFSAAMGTRAGELSRGHVRVQREAPPDIAVSGDKLNA